MSVLDMAFKRMHMLSTLQKQFDSNNSSFFGNSTHVGVLQKGAGGLPRGGGLQRNGAHLPAGNMKKHRPFVKELMAEDTKKTNKPIEDEKGEAMSDDEMYDQSMLRGDMASPFVSPGTAEQYADGVEPPEDIIAEQQQDPATKFNTPAPSASIEQPSSILKGMNANQKKSCASLQK